MTGARILVVRLGALGDIIHAMPAVASLKQGLSRCHLTWLVEEKWAPLLQGNPSVDALIPARRRSLREYFRLRSILREQRFDIAVDLQGLIKSAIVASAARPEKLYGFHRTCVREPLAALFYSHCHKASSLHVVDKNLELARAAGAPNAVKQFYLPEGKAEGDLPEGGFVLASPQAGWRSKQWPLAFFEELGRMLKQRLGLTLVLNGAEKIETPSTWSHVSSLGGLLHATRKALAVVGVDSGPIHIAAALNKPGVAIFGPTDPARNGPYSTALRVLRHPLANTTYKRGAEIDPSMQLIAPEQVFDAIAPQVRQALQQ